MNDWKTFFEDKRITVMGLGLLGRGVGDVEFLAKYAKEIIVTDLKSEKDLKESLAKLKRFKNISYTLGEHEFRDFENRDFILKAAGVPLDSPFIEHAKKDRVPIYMSTALFAELSPATTVGVTGTRGKSTVTAMIFETLKKAKLKQKVFLGGNVRGVSTLPLLAEAKKGDLVVLELDSWQLQGFGDLKISPNISVFTNFMPDHLNYYKNDMDAYFADKENIFKFQKKRDVSIVGEQVKKLGKKYALPSNIKLKIPGAHNRENAGLAYAALRALKISPAVIKKSFESFKGVEGRLELVRAYKGVKIYNDTTATTPHALAAALSALGEKRNVILIFGGTDKNISLDVLKDILKKCKALVILPGNGTDRLLEESIIPKDIPLAHAQNMKEAVSKALKMAQNKDIILLSPGFTSFGLFKNEYDRGEQFVKLIKNAK